MSSEQRYDKTRQQRSANERKSREKLFAKKTAESSSSSSSSKTATAIEAQKIQKSLLRTQSLLKNELQRVSQVANAIEDDGNVLQQAMDNHKALNTKNAQKALTRLQRAQQQEQRILMMSVGFFFMVAFYVLWCRVLIRVDFISPILRMLFG